MSDKFFCVAPFVHLYGHTTGAIKTCCVGETTYGDTKVNSLEEIWHNDEFKNLRKEFIAGDITENIAKNCATCINFEKSGVHSLRTAMNDSYMPFADIQEDPDLNLMYMDFRFNNFCNFKCRGCYNEYSSSINDEDHGERQDIIFAGKTDRDIFDQIYPLLEDVQKIYFAGGEPLIQWQHWEILERLVEIGRTDVTLVYNTNFSTMKYKGGKNVIDYWKKFTDIQLLLSFDGIDKGAEYWRNGSDWPRLVKNVHRVVNEAPHVNVGCTTTVGWANLYTAMDFIDYCSDNSKTFINPEGININVLQHPVHFCVQTLPDWKKEELEIRIRKTLHKYDSMGYKDSLLSRNLHALITFMWADRNDNVVLKGAWKRIVTKRDKLRNENFFETFPEHIHRKELVE